METKKDLTVYILSRDDLPSLNPGKAMAQIHHAGVQMMSKYHSHPLVKDYVSTGTKEGADHFNTTLVLSANSDEIKKIVKEAKKLDNVLHGTIIDPSYPFYVDNYELANLMPTVTLVGQANNGKILMTRKELTCAWFLGDINQSEFKHLFGALPLHP